LLEFGKKLEKLKTRNTDLKSYSGLMKQTYNEPSLLTILDEKYRDRLILWKNCEKYLKDTKRWGDTTFLKLDLNDIELSIRQFD